ncbi:hypothetical protein M514_05559 [Trichuris suis]|uniref:Uncharacterized protein n=1 Tax=Trichuris suis TaxID=68888 RepID=A0A085MZJ1_9BILA|nr:hypothetical protein M513_05559 [Trichuris suis]KFD62637.1 hypothetical protein M514_05559 [Trichuris suis]
MEIQNQHSSKYKVYASSNVGQIKKALSEPSNRGGTALFGLPYHQQNCLAFQFAIARNSDVQVRESKLSKALRAVIKTTIDKEYFKEVHLCVHEQ